MENPALSGISKFKEYTKKDVHDLVDPESGYYYYCGKWGINGVIRIGKFKDDFVLFSTLGENFKYHGKVQSIDKNGTVIWCAPMSYRVGSRELNDLLKTEPRKPGVFYFASDGYKMDSDGVKKYYYIGQLINPQIIDSKVPPLLIKWTLEDWDAQGIPKELLLE
jgi:hypothetical protein